MKRVIIVGGGITGLTTALHLKDRARECADGLEITVLEASSRLGGNIRTDREEGFTLERGPNGYLDNAPATPALVRRLGLEERVQKADESAAKRYLFRSGRLHLLPSGPIGFVRSPVLSLPGRVRVFREPFARSKQAGKDETIYEFVSRRLGHEMASVLIDAMVSGVFAGNIHELSLQSAFPKMAQMEAEHGSLIRAMLALMKRRKKARRQVAEMRARGEEVEELTQPGGPAGPGGTLTSFDTGLESWIDALAAELNGRCHTDSPVESISRSSAGAGAAWLVTTSSGLAYETDAVVLTIPSPGAAPLLRMVDGELGDAVAEIPTAGLAVVALGFDAGEMGGAPDGFGFLVPRGTGPRILGCLWDSSVFPGRAPDGMALMRVMIGGAHDPEAVELSDDELMGIVMDDLRAVMGLTAEPILTRIYRHPLGIGQYTVGHQARLDRIHSRLAVLPGLWVAGSSYYGISMNLCIQKAGEQAGEILAALG
jgi:oxygen-dependent protoporphyrinogen oxidase